MQKVRKVITLVVVIAIVAFVVMYGIATCAGQPTGTADRTTLPDIKEATDSFLVRNTGSLLLASKFEQFGTAEGSRTFVLHGYWEQVGTEYRYRKGDIPLSEKTFGIIDHKRRAK